MKQCFGKSEEESHLVLNYFYNEDRSYILSTIMILKCYLIYYSLILEITVYTFLP